MREIVHVAVGQCGNQMSTKFWEGISIEHGIAPDGQLEAAHKDQLQHLDVYYGEAAGGRYVPRCLLVDLEPGCLDAARASKYGSLFRPGKPRKMKGFFFPKPKHY